MHVYMIFLKVICHVVLWNMLVSTQLVLNHPTKLASAPVAMSAASWQGLGHQVLGYSVGHWPLIHIQLSIPWSRLVNSKDAPCEHGFNQLGHYIYIYMISIDDVSCTHVVACSWAILVRKKVAGAVILQPTVDSHGDPHASLWAYLYMHVYLRASEEVALMCLQQFIYFNIQCMRSIYNTVNPSYHHTSKNKNPCICRYAICKSKCINKNMHACPYIYIHIYDIYVWFYFIHGD